MACNLITKSSANCYLANSQTVANAGTISFDDIDITGKSITALTNSSNGVKLVNPGLYLIIVNGFGALASGATGGSLTVQLQENGSNVEEAMASAYTDSTTDVVGVGFSYVCQVNNSCGCVDNSKKITLVNDGVGITYGGLTMTIIKQA